MSLPKRSPRNKEKMDSVSSNNGRRSTRTSRAFVSFKEDSDDEDVFMQVIECSSQITPPSKQRVSRRPISSQKPSVSTKECRSSESDPSEVEDSSEGVEFEIETSSLPKRTKRRFRNRVAPTNKNDNSPASIKGSRFAVKRACSEYTKKRSLRVRKTKTDDRESETSSESSFTSSLHSDEDPPNTRSSNGRIVDVKINPIPLVRKRGPAVKSRPSSGCEAVNKDENAQVDGESSSGEDEQFDEKLLNEAKGFVKELYLPIFQKNEKNMQEVFRNCIKSAFLQPDTHPNGVGYRTLDGSKPVGLTFPREVIRKDAEVALVSNGSGVTSRPVPVHYVPAKTPFPRMKHWVHVEHNIKTEDNLRLSHIPYVDDEHDSVSFCSELKKAYPEGIHGTKKGWNMYISDYLLYLLLKDAIPKWEQSGKGLSYLYQAIFRLFPNKMTPRQLEYAFSTLEQRFDPKASVDKSNNSSRKEDMHHSISTMLCIKCQQFHCLLHGFNQEDFRMHRKRRSSKRDELEDPCSEKCYKILLEAEEDSPEGSPSMGSPKSKRSRKQQLDEKKCNTAPFSPTTHITFQKMVQNNRNSFCQLAVMMDAIAPKDPRTCQEIYLMAKMVPPPEREQSPDDIMERKITVREQQSSFRNFTWSNGRGQVDNSAQPFACRHKGLCGQNVKDCYCGQNNTLCSKYCCCGPDCRMKFPGCRCQPGACRTKQCQCFFAKWECDPDVCRSCNCGPYYFASKDAKDRADLDDSADEKDEASCSSSTDVGPQAAMPVCSNINIQRGNYKKLRVGISNVAGYGCFINEPAEKGEFIAEYTGEVISKWEAERRGRVYDEYKCSYIFALNKEQSIDATRFGNHIRFANHSDKHPNCYSQIIMVNGEHRIGLFAKRRIEIGEELLFDYQYDKKWKEQYVPVEINRAGTVCQHASGKKNDIPKRSKKESIVIAVL